MQVRTMEIKHIDETTKVHMEAFKNYMNVLLGYRYNAAFFKWFITNNSVHLIGLNDKGSVVGYVVGAELGYQEFLTKALMPSAVFALIRKPWILFNMKIIKVVWERLKLILHIANKKKKVPEKNYGKTISLVSIGVSDSVKNTGIARSLEKEFTRQAKEMGFDSARLSVYQNNPRAIGFYEKSGWKMENISDNVAVYYKEIT